jgi:hypothetical protein
MLTVKVGPVQHRPFARKFLVKIVPGGQLSNMYECVLTCSPVQGVFATTGYQPTGQCSPPTYRLLLLRLKFYHNRTPAGCCSQRIRLLPFVIRYGNWPCNACQLCLQINQLRPLKPASAGSTSPHSIYTALED